MFSKCDFLLLQETWKTESEFIRNFKNDFPGSECITASQMDLDGIKAGRPYGGVAICYHAGLKCKIETIPTDSKSICALKLGIDQISILLVNVYMPCSDNNDALEKYTSILNEIRALCIKNVTQHLILAGDWNADPIRNDRRTTLFKNFIAEETLINVLNKDIANVPYTYWNQRVTPPTTSTVDHFLLSPNLANIVTQYETVFQHNDFSDHFPVMLTLNINVKYQKTYKKEFKPSVAWYKCNDTHIDSYKKHMDNLLLKLNPMQEALTCKTTNVLFTLEMYIHYIKKSLTYVIKRPKHVFLTPLATKVAR